MLLYCNRSFWRLVLTSYGSVFFRGDNIAFGLALGALATFIQYLRNSRHTFAPDLPHHYGMHALGVVVGFAVVFRTNLGWTRYWEAITQLHIMYSKWADAYSQLYAFASSSIETGQQKGTEDGLAKAARVEAFLHTAGIHFSIMSALAADRLSHGDTQRMEKRREMVEWRHQITLRRTLRYEDMTESRKLPAFCIQEQCTRRSAVPRPDEPTNLWNKSTYSVTGLPSQEEGNMLERSTDRVNVVMYWIIHLLSQCSKDLDIAPPIQSRMYQELSNGMLGFSQALKIADVPFPFPYAQLLTVILFAYACFIPFYVSIFSDSLYVSPIMTFLLFQGIWGINEVAKELENPFGADVNDISLADFHSRFMDLMCEVRESNSISTKRRFTVPTQQATEATDARVDKEPKATPKEPVPSTAQASAAAVAAPAQQPPATAAAFPSAYPAPAAVPAAAPVVSQQESRQIFQAIQDDITLQVLPPGGQVIVEVQEAPSSEVPPEVPLKVSRTPSRAEDKVQEVPAAPTGVKDRAWASSIEVVSTSPVLPSFSVLPAHASKVSDAVAPFSEAQLELPTALAGGPGLRVTEVLNVHLAKMAACMEEHLGRISAELEAISVRTGTYGDELPTAQFGMRRDKMML